MSEQKKQDRRTIKTKRAIHNAFAKLLAEKDINDISVRDIVDLADINRKTFYNYYAGIHELVDEIENDIIRTFEGVLGEINFKEAIENPYQIFEKLTVIINSDLDFYGHLISIKSDSNLITKIVILMKKKTREAMISQLPIDDKKADVLLDFVFSGMLSVYRNWFLSDRRQPIEEIAEIISALCFRGIGSVMDVE